MGKKDTSVDTELIGLSSDSIQNIRYLSLSIYTECLSWSITQPSPFFRDHRQYTPRRSQSQSNITPLRTVTSEALRAYHQTTSSDNNSERSTSTASQSQCGHNDSKKYHSGRHNANNSISYISSGSSEHQIALALALANTEGYLAQVHEIHVDLDDSFILTHFDSPRNWLLQCGEPPQCLLENQDCQPQPHPLPSLITVQWNTMATINWKQ